MYIAHTCPKCRTGDVVNNLDKYVLTCEIRDCGYTEDEKTFWRYYNYEGYARDLEDEIKKRFPDHEIEMVPLIIALAVGNHVLGRFDARDSNYDTVLEYVKGLYKNWGFCYLPRFAQKSAQKQIEEYQRIRERSPEPDYEQNFETIDAFFANLAQDVKAACR